MGGGQEVQKRGLGVVEKPPHVQDEFVKGGWRSG